MSGAEAEEEDINDERSVERDLLAQLQDLHRQLELLRRESALDSEGKQLLEERHKLIVCAVCKPIRMSKNPEDDTWIYSDSRAGFTSAIGSMERDSVRWVSWLGTHVERDSQEGVRRKLETEYSCSPVFLPRDIQQNYMRFCRNVLWPIFHSIPFYFDEGLLDAFPEQYEAYSHANQQFVEEVADLYEDGDLVLVYDYDLLLLPSLLRKRVPDIKCGFFLHTPFPSIEFYSMLPVRQHLLQGILGADLVSFNHFDYLRNFLNACTRVLGLESGINPDLFKRNPTIEKHIQTLEHRLGKCKIIVCVDRLDLCKGLPHKLLIMEALLEQHPEWSGRVIMFLIVKERGLVDKSLARNVDRLVGHINGKFGSVSYLPIHYCKRMLTSDEIIALYSVADVSLVTSLSEGINLTAMEFVACQQESRRGVLIYSEFAGCADSFKGALVVNPYDTQKVAETVHTALTMGETTKQVRHHQLSRYVSAYTAARWAKSMISSLGQAVEKACEYNNLQRLDVGQLRLFYERSRRRLFVLDYDGTLVSHKSLPQLASPPRELLETLTALCNDPCNTVYIVSGRTRSDLDEWFAHIANLGLSAEQGYYIRCPSKWRAERAQILKRKEVESQLSLETFTSSVTESRLSPTVDVAETEDKDEPSAPSPVRGSSMFRFQTCSNSYHTQTYVGTFSPPAKATSAPFISPQEDDERLDRNGVHHEEVSPVGRRSSSDVDMLPTIESSAGSYLRVNVDLLESQWELKAPNLDLAWKDEVILTLEDITERTPGSFLENKDCSLTWHFRDCDPDFGMTQAKNLQLHFDQMLEHEPVRVVTALQKKYLVITPSRINKGRAVQQILYEHEAAGDKFDLILAFGDERTDEDMFDVLQGTHCFTCTVGRKISRATYYVDSPEEASLALQALAQASEKHEREAPSTPLQTSSISTHHSAGPQRTHGHTLEGTQPLLSHSHSQSSSGGTGKPKPHPRAMHSSTRTGRSTLHPSTTVTPPAVIQREFGLRPLPIPLHAIPSLAHLRPPQRSAQGPRASDAMR